MGSWRGKRAVGCIPLLLASACSTVSRAGTLLSAFRNHLTEFLDEPCEGGDHSPFPDEEIEHQETG